MNTSLKIKSGNSFQIANTDLSIKTGRASSLAPVLEALTAPHPVARQLAVETLGLFGGRSIVLKILPLLNDPCWLVRETVVETLAYLGDREAQTALRELVIQHSEVRISSRIQHQTLQRAVRLLGEWCDPKAERLLIKVFKKGYRDATLEWNIELRQAAASSLARLGTPAAVKTLLTGVRQDEFPQVRESVTGALCLLCNQAGFQQLLKGLDKRFLEDTSSFRLRQEAVVKALGRFGNPAAIPCLLKLKANQYNKLEVVRKEALYRLGYYQSSAAQQMTA